MKGKQLPRNSDFFVSLRKIVMQYLHFFPACNRDLFTTKEFKLQHLRSVERKFVFNFPGSPQWL